MSNSFESRSTLSYLLLAWIALTLVDSAFPQLQLLLFGSRILLPNWTIDALALIGLICMLAIRGLPRPASAIGWSFSAFGAYLLVDSVFLIARKELSLGPLITDLYRYYFLLMLLPAVYLWSGRLHPNRASSFLLVALVPLCVLGIYQHFGGEALIPTSSIDGRFEVFAWQFHGDIRAFSLFNSGWSFGHFCAFLAALVLLSWLAANRVPGAVWLLLLGLSLAAVYSSYTRTAFLVCGATLAAAAFITQIRSTSRTSAVHLLPFAFAACAWIVAVGAAWFVKAMDLAGEDLFRLGSLDSRWDAWALYGGQWLSGSWSDVLFGLGTSQRSSGSAYSESTVLIDNAFIVVGVQIGLIGLLLWIACVWSAWMTIVDIARRTEHPLHWAIVAIWSTWPLSLTFCGAFGFYGGLAILAVITANTTEARHTIPGFNGGYASLMPSTRSS